MVLLKYKNIIKNRKTPTNTNIGCSYHNPMRREGMGDKMSITTWYLSLPNGSTSNSKGKHKLFIQTDNS